MMLLITHYKKLLGLLVCLPLAVLFAIVSLLIISPKPALHDGLSYSTAICDRNGNLLRLTLSQDDKYRLWIPLKDVSPKMIESTLLYEDQYFYWHCGINPFSLFRAIWKTYLTGGQPAGASTITMQLVRIRFKLATRSVSGGSSSKFLKPCSLNGTTPKMKSSKHTSIWPPMAETLKEWAQPARSIFKNRLKN
jgi:Membrane carboxypeptidase/penicillin-binding protein PbpC